MKVCIELQESAPREDLIPLLAGKSQRAEKQTDITISFDAAKSEILLGLGKKVLALSLSRLVAEAIVGLTLEEQTDVG
ncbi:MAG: hypothetical protein WC992_07065 [Acholeplasmataceae bacterium]|jgi:hypothetical protein